jgi:hypothetical protein
MSEGGDQTGSISAAAIVGLIAAGASALGYGVAFAFEAGFVNHFGVPIDLVSVSIERVFIAMVAVIFAILPLVVTLNLIYLLIPERYEGHLYLFEPLILAIAVALAGLLIFLDLPALLYICLALSAFILFMTYVTPMFGMKQRGGYFRGLIESEDAEMVIHRRGLVGRLKKRFGTGIVFAAFLFLYVVPFIAYHIGGAQARRQNTFLVAQELTELVVIRVYGDRVICAPLRPDMNALMPVIRVLRLTDGRALSLEVKRVGPFEPTKFADGKKKKANSTPSG